MQGKAAGTMFSATVTSPLVFVLFFFTFVNDLFPLHPWQGQPLLALQWQTSAVGCCDVTEIVPCDVRTSWWRQGGAQGWQTPVVWCHPLKTYSAFCWMAWDKGSNYFHIEIVRKDLLCVCVLRAQDKYEILKKILLNEYYAMYIECSHTVFASVVARHTSLIFEVC